MRRAAVCSIVPPYILRNIAERGEGEAAAVAREAIALSAELRRQDSGRMHHAREDTAPTPLLTAATTHNSRPAR